MKKSIITLLIAATLLSTVATAAPVQRQLFSDCESEYLELSESQSIYLTESVECGNSGDDVAPWVALIAIILLIGAAAAAS